MLHLENASKHVEQISVLSMSIKPRNCKYLYENVQAKAGTVLIVSMTKSILNLQCGNAANGKLSRDALPWQVRNKNATETRDWGCTSCVLCCVKRHERPTSHYMLDPGPGQGTAVAQITCNPWGCTLSGA